MWSSCRRFSPAMAFHSSGSASASDRERLNMARVRLREGGKRHFSIGGPVRRWPATAARTIAADSPYNPRHRLRGQREAARQRRACAPTDCRRPQRPHPSGGRVNALLALSRAIDALNERIGHDVYWLVLVAVLISAANAVVRKAFNVSSNVVPRDPVVPVLGDLPVLRRLHAAARTSTCASTSSPAACRRRRRRGSTSSARSSS